MRTHKEQQTGEGNAPRITSGQITERAKRITASKDSPFVNEALRLLIEAETQRDELLSACKSIIDANDAPCEYDDYYAGFLTVNQTNALRAAIANAEKQ